MVTTIYYFSLLSFYNGKAIESDDTSYHKSQAKNIYYLDIHRKHLTISSYKWKICISLEF